MKEKRQFSIFNSHLDLAHQIWEKHLKKGDWAIDATCGNGYDTLFLAEKSAQVIGMDIQKKAIENTELLLQENGIDPKNIYFFEQDHQDFPSLAHKSPISLIVYNLGYLPGGNKTFTTKVESTLKSLHKAIELIRPGGLISITCYPGHPEGLKEQEALLSFCHKLSSQTWHISQFLCINRLKSPTLLLLQNKIIN